ncbi:MAG: MarR family winged helix-turn-helix transcriptional regulator [Pleurocapsa sp. MO_226.B13]|nr:MarR family winged helix-turn-helix transcriptional regulator [Pleurocapsa sp. MO_226.B13]
MDIKELAREISDKCVASQVRQLDRSVSRIYDTQLRPYGLKISQFTILVAIANLGEASPQIISSTLNLEKSTLSRGLERMIKKEWLEASYSDAGRIQTVALTEAGKRQILQASRSWSKAQEQVEQLIEHQDRSVLFKITRSINK